MSWTLGTSTAVLLKVGANVNSVVSNSGLFMQKAADIAEATIMAKTNFDWVSNYSNVETGFRGVLEDAFSNYVGIQLINYDMSGYTSNGEAVTMINILKDNFDKNILDLKDRNIQALGGV